MRKRIPRVLIAGLRGGSGKTVVAVGLSAALRARERSVSPFKKGPDYIDAAWLASAADRPCRNLDLFLMSPGTVLGSFAGAAGPNDVAVIEGNRGLYDGMDAAGTYSSAELAKLLEAPVLLTIDCTKSTRTVAAMVLGCRHMDPDVPIRGVILNQLSGDRHESVLREAIEAHCGVPVVGAIRKLRKQVFPERHLGLVPPPEHGEVLRAVDEAGRVVAKHLDLDAITRIAESAPELTVSLSERHVKAPDKETVRVAVFRDAAFQFYYPENLEALEQEGAKLVETSPIRDEKLPDVDAVYIGGGFPETLARELSPNVGFHASLTKAIEKGIPVFAECGGAVYLGRNLTIGEETFPMCGVFPVDYGFGKRPQGHGYTVVETVEANPFFREGDSYRGHEFHYTHMLPSSSPDLKFALRVRRGFGFDGERDGLVYRNVLASYTHIHALGLKGWAATLVRQAIRYRQGSGNA